MLRYLTWQNKEPFWPVCIYSTETVEKGEMMPTTANSFWSFL